MEQVNLISISGPRGGGKDTVGRLIKTLTSGFDLSLLLPDEIVKLSTSQTIGSNEIKNWRQLWTTLDIDKDQNWQIKKFAGKLKEVASLLTGIPAREFEEPEVKDMELPDEWAASRWGAFEPMKVRQFLQILATEAIRDNLHPDTWVIALFADYKPIYVGPTPTFNDPACATDEVELPKWIITDTRFINELQAVKQRGGICIRVNREAAETGDPHSSETEWREWDFDYTINNDGTLEELIHEVRRMLSYFKIKY